MRSSSLFFKISKNRVFWCHFGPKKWLIVFSEKNVFSSQINFTKKEWQSSHQKSLRHKKITKNVFFVSKTHNFGGNKKSQKTWWGEKRSIFVSKKGVHQKWRVFRGYRFGPKSKAENTFFAVFEVDFTISTGIPYNLQKKRGRFWGQKRSFFRVFLVFLRSFCNYWLKSVNKQPLRQKDLKRSVFGCFWRKNTKKTRFFCLFLVPAGANPLQHLRFLHFLLFYPDESPIIVLKSVVKNTFFGPKMTILDQHVASDNFYYYLGGKSTGIPTFETVQKHVFWTFFGPKWTQNLVRVRHLNAIGGSPRPPQIPAQNRSKTSILAKNRDFTIILGEVSRFRFCVPQTSHFENPKCSKRSLSATRPKKGLEKHDY